MPENNEVTINPKTEALFQRLQSNIHGKMTTVNGKSRDDIYMPVPEEVVRQTATPIYESNDVRAQIAALANRVAALEGNGGE